MDIKEIVGIGLVLLLFGLWLGVSYEKVRDEQLRDWTVRRLVEDVSHVKKQQSYLKTDIELLDSKIELLESDVGKIREREERIIRSQLPENEQIRLEIWDEDRKHLSTGWISLERRYGQSDLCEKLLIADGYTTERRNISIGWVIDEDIQTREGGEYKDWWRIECQYYPSWEHRSYFEADGLFYNDVVLPLELQEAFQ